MKCCSGRGGQTKNACVEGFANNVVTKATVIDTVVILDGLILQRLWDKNVELIRLYVLFSSRAPAVYNRATRSSASMSMERT